MQIGTLILLLILGLFLIVKGGDLLVDACLLFSKVTGINQIIVGATLVSIATALPEICISFLAISKGYAALAVGNALGSMICNIALVLGIGILIMPPKIKKKTIQTKANFLIFLTLLLFTLSFNFRLGLLEGILLIGMGGLFFYMNIKEARKQALKNTIKQKPVKKDWASFLIKFILGTIGIFFGAQILVQNGERLATVLGVSEELIGFTILAFSTCLPELVTELTAIQKKSMDLALGNILGANTLNITLLFGFGAILSGKMGLMISTDAVTLLLPLLILLTLFLILPIFLFQKVVRFQGILLLGIYITYLVIILST